MKTCWTKIEEMQLSMYFNVNEETPFELFMCCWMYDSLNTETKTEALSFFLLLAIIKSNYVSSIIKIIGAEEVIKQHIEHFY